MGALPERIFHIATASAWQAAADAYRGDSLASEGFIHCSFADQVLRVADARFAGRSDLLLLAIDPERVAAEIRCENLEGGDEPFPHVYGPLERGAVTDVEPLFCDDSGAFVAPACLVRARGDASRALAAQPADGFFQRLNRSLGPVVGGLVLDMVDLATFGPVGLYGGFLLGGAVGWWLATLYGFRGAGRGFISGLAALYAGFPGTAFVPLATIVGGLLRLRDFRSPPGEGR